MNGTMYRGRWFACAVLLAGGCGTVPDIIVDTARSSAKEALREAVDGVIDSVFEDTLDELIRFTGLELPSIPKSERYQDGVALEETGEDVDDGDQDTDRAARTPGSTVRTNHPTP